MLYIVFSAVAVLLVVFFIIYFLPKPDADLTLKFFERFGKTPEAYFYKKTVWITGASSGIGEELAYRLARCGCRLILSARRESELERVKQACLGKHWELHEEDIAVVPLDLVDLESLPEIAKRAYNAFGKIDAIVHNAGRSQRAPWADIEPEVDMECFKLNALGPTVLTRSLMSRLIAQENGCHVVVVSSMAGLMGVICSASYSAAKHALNGYFRSMAVEHSTDRIRLTLTCPSLTYSPNNVASAFTKTKGQALGQALKGPTSKHMLGSRCAELICVAASNNISECWMSKQFSVMGLAYVSVYFPGLAKLALKFIGTAKLKKIRDGTD